MKKMPGDIITLPMCNKNYDQMMYCSWDMVRDGRKDRLTDGRKKWHIEVGAPPKIIDLIFFLATGSASLHMKQQKWS